MSDVFGPIVYAGHIEDAALDTLRVWLPTYLAELAERAGKRRASLPAPRSWTRVGGIDRRFPENALPTIAVTAASLADTPAQRGDGRVWAAWDLAVGVVVSSGTQDAADDLANLYVAAIRTCLLQRRLPILEGFEALEWVGEEADEVEADKRRSLAGGVVSFDVRVKDVVDVYAGPTEPDPRPRPHNYDDLPTVSQASVTARAGDGDQGSTVTRP